MNRLKLNRKIYNTCTYDNVSINGQRMLQLITKIFQSGVYLPVHSNDIYDDQIQHCNTYLLLGIYGKCMTQTKRMHLTTIHTGKVWGMSKSIKKTYTKTYIYI